MENNVEKALDTFMEDTPANPPIRRDTVTSTAKSTRQVVLEEREGLIERVDKVFVTKEGKQLLREQY